MCVSLNRLHGIIIRRCGDTQKGGAGVIIRRQVRRRAVAVAPRHVTSWQLAVAAWPPHVRRAARRALRAQVRAGHQAGVGSAIGSCCSAAASRHGSHHKSKLYSPGSRNMWPTRVGCSAAGCPDAMRRHGPDVPQSDPVTSTMQSDGLAARLQGAAGGSGDVNSRARAAATLRVNALLPAAQPAVAMVVGREGLLMQVSACRSCRPRTPGCTPCCMREFWPARPVATWLETAERSDFEAAARSARPEHSHLLGSEHRRPSEPRSAPRALRLQSPRAPGKPAAPSRSSAGAR